MTWIATQSRRFLFGMRGGSRLDNFEDESRARSFHFLLTCFVIWLFVNIVIAVPLFAANKRLGTVLSVLLLASTVAALRLLRRARFRGACLLFVWTLWCLMEVFGVLNRGVLSPLHGLIFLLVVNAAWLLGREFSFAMAAASLLVALVEALLQHTGHQFPVSMPGNPIAVWFVYLASLPLTLIPVASTLEALRASNERYRGLFDRSLECVFLIDFAGRFLDANQAALDLLGYQREDIPAVTIQSLMTEDQLPLALARMEEISATGRQSKVSEYSLRRKDGKRVFVEIRSSLIYREGRPFAIQGIARDVTERKSMEAELQNSRDSIAALLESTAEIIFSVDRQYRLLSFNSAFVEHLRHSYGTSAQLGDLPKDYLPADRAARWISLCDRVFTDGAFSLEYGLLDGRVLEIAFHPILRGQEALGASMFAKDITERKRVEVALRESEDRYRSLFENAPVGVFYSTSEGKILGVNEEYARILGFASPEEAKEIVNQSTIADSVYVESGERSHLLERAAASPGKWIRTEQQFRKKDGSRITANLRLRVLPETPGQLEGFLEDITERKRAEEALRQSEKRFSRAIAATAEAVWEWNAQTGQTYYSPRWYEMLGYGDEHFPMTFESWKSLVHPEDLPPAMTLIQATLSDLNNPGYAAEFRMRHQDGSWRWILGRGNVVERDAAGQPVMLSGTNTDITAQKLLEEQLRQSQKMEAIGQLAGGVAHDFNNLLTVINGYSNLALGGLKTEDSLHHQLQEILKAGERAAGLTRQLLAFSRKQILQPRVLELNRVVEELESMLQRLLGEDVEFQLALSEERPVVYADPHQLEQVLMNLVVNARDAMHEGGKLLIETSAAAWDESCAALHPEVRPGRYAKLAVCDTGVGMDEATRRRIFEPFFTTKDAGHGTGLGLSMVQGIIAQSGGHIDVYSEVGQGTSFNIYLPLSADNSAVAEIATVIPVARGTETILVVEDQEDVRTLTAAALDQYGYRTLQAANADEALLMCEREGAGIHLVLTDVIMPHANGRALAQRLKKMIPAVKILYMSGYSDTVIADHGVLVEGAEFIAKPFTPEALASKVRAVLGEAPTRAKILVVDDDAAVRSFLCAVLEEGGYEVSEAEDGLKALNYALANPLDVVITDLIMPEKEGIETIRALRRQRPEIAIIALSGALDGQFLSIAQALGAKIALTKPVRPEALLAEVAKVLASRKAMRSLPAILPTDL
jgi:PAS domain S-box-containing protein